MCSGLTYKPFSRVLWNPGDWVKCNKQIRTPRLIVGKKNLRSWFTPAAISFPNAERSCHGFFIRDGKKISSHLLKWQWNNAPRDAEQLIRWQVRKNIYCVRSTILPTMWTREILWKDERCQQNEFRGRSVSPQWEKNEAHCPLPEKWITFRALEVFQSQRRRPKSKECSMQRALWLVRSTARKHY